MTTDPNDEAQGTEAQENEKPSGPLDVLLPYDVRIWEECRRMVVDKSVRVDALATVAAQDPVIVMDLLRVSNAMFFSGGRAPITSVKTAIVRLGSEVLLDQLEKLKSREPLEDPGQVKWFEVFRSKARRASIVARLLSETLARNLSDDSQAGGLLSYVGEMLAVQWLGDTYVNLAENNARTGVNYQLMQKHSFDVEKMGLNYLHKYGIPEALLFAIDRDAQSRNQDRALLRPIVFAATELVEAFDTDKWEKFAPGAKLPPKSHVRMLQISDAQYLKVYERASEFLFAMRMADAKSEQAAEELEDVEDIYESDEYYEEEAPAKDSLASDIEDLISGRDTGEAEEYEEEESQTPQKQSKSKPTETKIHQVSRPLNDPNDQFSLASPKPKISLEQLSRQKL